MKTPALLILAGLLLLTGCLTSNSRLNYLQIGMSKAESVAAIGHLGVIRGAILNKSGQNIEVVEYRMDRPGEEDGNYWLYFANDRLVQWGAAGDWSTERERVYNVHYDMVNFNLAPAINNYNP